MPEGFEAQCEQAWRNVIEVLATAGLEVGHLVKINTFLTDRNQVEANRAVRRKMLQGHEPASTVIVARRWQMVAGDRGDCSRVRRRPDL